MSLSLWQQCLARLQDELPATEFSMWIRPLQAELSDNTLALYAPNRFVLDWVRDKYLNNINGLLNDFCGTDAPLLRFEVGSKPLTQTLSQPVMASVNSAPVAPVVRTAAPSRPSWTMQHRRLSCPIVPTSTPSTPSITSLRVSLTSWLVLRRGRWQTIRGALITHCSCMAVPAWVNAPVACGR